MKPTIQTYQDIILPIIIKYAPTARIILFGSRAQGTASEGADIDIAIDNKTPINPIILSNINEELENSLLPINFDIVDFATVTDAIKAEIIQKGIVWK